MIRLPFRTRALPALLLTSVLTAARAHASTWYVRSDAGSGGTGTSWAAAFGTVQAGLAAAQSGDAIWVAASTYRPGTGISPRTVTFELKSGVALYGGFAGTETALAERDWVAHTTVLSGDLLLDDAPGFANRTDNCYHVVHANNTSAGTLLDGFVVRGGQADGSGSLHSAGAGIRADGNLVLRNLVVEENEAVGLGGGLAAVELGANVAVLVERSTFRRNRAGEGGAIGADTARIDLVGSALLSNEAGRGGGLALTFLFDNNCSVSNCLVAGNVATNAGGGVSLFYSTIVIRSSSIGYNHAQHVGGVPGGDFGSWFANTIVWGNTDVDNASVLVQQIGTTNMPQGVATVVQGGNAPWNDDPRWSDPLGTDGVAGTEDDDFTLSCLSPYIDRGANAAAAGTTVDLAGNPRFADDPATPDQGTGTPPIVDLGPYEFVCACDDFEAYCTALPNSSGLPASIGASGSTSLFANSLVLHVADGPPFKNGLFFYGALQTSLPWGDGIRCVGGSLFRLSVVTLDASGAVSFAFDATQPPAVSGSGQVLEGSTWNFQFYFRDPTGGPAGWNASNALSVAFCR